MGTCCIDGESADVFREEWLTARKQHKCCECRIAINPGEHYQRVVMLAECLWSTYKTCEKCADLRESLLEVDCPYYGGLSEAYQNWLTDGPNTIMSVKPGSHPARLVPDYFLQEDEYGR